MIILDIKGAMAIVIAIIMATLAMILVPAVIIITFPMMITYFANLSTLSGFTWSSFFNSGGIMYLLLSTGILLVILSIPLSLVGLGIWYMAKHFGGKR